MNREARLRRVDMDALALLCDRLVRERRDCKISVRCQAMPRILAGCHEAVARSARCIFPLAAKAGDEPTADLLTPQLTPQEPTAWIPSSHRQARNTGQAAGAGRPSQTVSASDPALCRA
jgi:hypothetical protein